MTQEYCNSWINPDYQDDNHVGLRYKATTIKHFHILKTKFDMANIKVTPKNWLKKDVIYNGN